ncbi:aldehyde oxidase GLOX-like [Amaranthus tricolor]|uniref:aldehyde oxidase GLOX-like n=1 Tax=Amaranthus tricolor TaxID=29722 RepID=UPI00258AAB00|nr:aldehyde oxidase GLOX-like [Amaranthus tricolor]
MSHFFLLFIIIICLPCTTLGAEGGSGRWHLLQRSIGISAMHMQLLHDDSVVIFDRTDFGNSNLPLAAGRCRRDQNEEAIKKDCTAHSAKYNSLTNTFRPLTVLTDTWCSSGAILPNGTLVQTGGFNDGIRVVRMIHPSCSQCDWIEFPNMLLAPRWYASNHILPDGRLIIIGGRQSFNYEFYPKKETDQLFELPFLEQTNDDFEENNLYPYVFLHVDGNLFIFANNRAILFDYNKSAVVRTYPSIPGGEPRNYPSTGSAVLLPLRNLELGVNMEVEVLICGGAPRGSFTKALNTGQFLTTLNTCARMKISDPDPKWEMETMPMGRVMSDMLILPNEDVIIINGASLGTAGWELGRNPVLTPVIYHPDNTTETRFEVQRPAKIPRMYHSCSIVLRDGRVLVAGSNPHSGYNFTGVLYPTELSVEAFSPPYLDSSKTRIRPTFIKPLSGYKIKYGMSLKIKFSIKGEVDLNTIKVTMLRPPFNTHSFSMSQRLLVLTNIKPVKTSVVSGQFDVQVRIPGSANIAPPGFYIIFVVHQSVPSEGIWVQLHNCF